MTFSAKVNLCLRLMKIVHDCRSLANDILQICTSRLRYWLNTRSFHFKYTAVWIKVCWDTKRLKLMDKLRKFRHLCCYAGNGWADTTLPTNNRNNEHSQREFVSNWSVCVDWRKFYYFFRYLRSELLDLLKKVRILLKFFQRVMKTFECCLVNRINCLFCSCVVRWTLYAKSHQKKNEINKQGMTFKE